MKTAADVTLALALLALARALALCAVCAVGCAEAMDAGAWPASALGLMVGAGMLLPRPLSSSLSSASVFRRPSALVPLPSRSALVVLPSGLTSTTEAKDAF